MKTAKTVTVLLLATLLATTWAPMAAPAPAAYAIRNARIVTVWGAPIDRGTIVMRNGVIEDVGPSVTPPADAVMIDGSNMTVYPGLIDMANTSVVAPLATEAAPAAGRAGAAVAGRGAAPAGSNETYADRERRTRENILNPDFDAARNVRADSVELQRLAAAGITSVLAVPSTGIFRGQSALINTAAPAESPEISTVAADRRGLVVVRSGVAQHVAFATGRGGGEGYPGSLLGVMAFIRQSLLDAQWQRDARAFADRHKDAPLQAFEPTLDALAPALEGRVPVAFDADQEREILRALGFAKDFKLDPIIVGGAEAATVAEDLKAAKARVICSVNFAAAGRGGGGGRGGGADTPMRVIRAGQNAPKVPGTLDKAGITIAFTSQGLATPGDLVRMVGRAVRDGGLSPESAVRALTLNAAKLAGVGDRLGSIEKGRMANVIVTDGDLFADATKIKQVFVNGSPVDLDSVPGQTPAPGRGRGGHQ